MKDFVAGDTVWISNMPIWNNKKIIGYESFLAVITKEWYDCNNKHWFILQKGDGSTIRLYRFKLKEGERK